jgi:hypothetical protein
MYNSVDMHEQAKSDLPPAAIVIRLFGELSIARGGHPVALPASKKTRAQSSPDLVSVQLLKAGFVRPCFERFDADISIGQTVDEAVELGMEVGPAGEILRLAGADADRYRADVIRTLRELCGEWATPDGVKGRSSSWICASYRCGPCIKLRYAQVSKTRASSAMLVSFSRRSYASTDRA